MKTLSILIALALTVCEAAKCPLGTRRSGKDCIPCRPGTASDNPDWGCFPCPSGTVTSFSGVKSPTVCIPCGPSAVPNGNRTECIPCPEGTASTISGTCVRCSPGTLVSGSSCEPCDEFSVAPDYNMRQCIPCRDLLYPNDSGTKCIYRMCDPGSIWDTWLDDDWTYKQGCVECPATTVRPSWQRKCRGCGATKGIPAIGPKTKCVKCPPGTFLPPPDDYGFLERRCTICPGNSTTIGTGKGYCRTPGETCPPHMFEDSEGDCQSCPKNYRFAPWRKTCDKCPEGQVSAGGRVTRCRRCPGNSKVINGRCDCPSGHIFANGKCRLCPAGTFRTAEGFAFLLDNHCHACGEFEYSEPGSSKCKACPERWSSRSSKGAKCEPPPECPSGLIIPQFDSMYAETPTCVSPITGCPPGLVNAERQNTVACLNSTSGMFNCPSNRVFTNRRQGNPCEQCESGVAVWRPNAKAWKCKTCDYDQVRVGGLFGKCRKCPEGFRPDMSGLERCICAEGSYLSGKRCERCPSSGWLPSQCLFQAMLGGILRSENPDDFV